MSILIFLVEAWLVFMAICIVFAVGMNFLIYSIAGLAWLFGYGRSKR